MKTTQIFLASLLLLAVPFVAAPTWAESTNPLRSVTATGKVIYKKSDGILVERSMTLEVPSRGHGEVVLRGGGLELRTHTFNTVKAGGRTVFRIEFSSAPGAPAGTQMLLEGTYMRDSNMAIYFGDIYGRNPTLGQNDWSHVGGFKFKTETE